MCQASVLQFPFPSPCPPTRAFLSGLHMLTDFRHAAMGCLKYARLLFFLFLYNVTLFTAQDSHFQNPVQNTKHSNKLSSSTQQHEILRILLFLISSCADVPKLILN